MIGHFMLLRGEENKINERLSSFGLSADDVISITWCSDTRCFYVWFKKK